MKLPGNFYDQSYFIRMYRKMTDANPSKFYNTIAKLADEQRSFSLFPGHKLAEKLQFAHR